MIVTSTGNMRQVEAISGSDGRLLWAHQIEAKHYKGPFQWAPDGNDFEIESKCLNSLCVDIQQTLSVIVSTGRRLVRLDSSNGNEVSVLYWKNWPIEEMTSGNLTADDSDDILIRHTSEEGQFTITAIDATTSTAIWKYESGPLAGNATALLVENVDQTAQANIIFAHTEYTHGPHRGNSYGICRMLSGATGEVVWSSERISDGHQTSETRVRTVSDLDGDGSRDVLAVHTKRPDKDMQYRGEALWTHAGIVIVTHALSGRDGRTIWKDFQHDAHGSFNTQPNRIHEWTDGTNGRPQIIVSRRTDSSSGQNRADSYVLDTREDGSVNDAHYPVRVIPDAEDVNLADFNGDGHLDVYWHEQLDTSRLDLPTTLHTIAGGSPVMWRRLGFWFACSDLDGDSTIDLIDASPHNQAYGLTAISGRSGRRLWHNPQLHGTPHPLQLPHGDIDDDGGADIITYSTHRDSIILQAVSGKTGESIWSREEPLRPDGPFGGSSHDLSFRHVATLDVDLDGSNDVVLLTDRGQMPDIIVIDAKSAAIKWHTSPRSDRQNRDNIWIANRAQFLANDASSLLVVRLDETKKLTLEALDGNTGNRLWERVPTVHELPLIEVARTPTHTVEDLPYLRTRWRGPPVSLVLDGDDQRHTCFAQNQELLIVDQSDGPRGTISIPGRLVTNSSLKSQLFSVDTDGDGRSELITTTWIDQEIKGFPSKLKKTVVALKLTPLDDSLSHEIMWEWKMPSGFGDIIAIDRTPQGNPHIAARSGSTVFSIDARTGEVRWTCDGPQWWTQDVQARRAIGTYQYRRPVILQRETNERPASVLFRRYTDGGGLYAVDCRFPISIN